VRRFRFGPRRIVWVIERKVDQRSFAEVVQGGAMHRQQGRQLMRCTGRKTEV
jgi:hypothetical protein